MLDLITLFESLDTPSSVGRPSVRYSAQPIPGYEPHRIARDEAGAPVVLLAVADATVASSVPPTVLEHISVQHDIECRIGLPDGTSEFGRFTLVQCRGADRVLRTYFLKVVGSVVLSLGGKPTRPDISSTIGALVELFRALSALPRKSVQGLWAELFLIARARDPLALLTAWHVAPEDLYDFSAGSQRLEVKSAAGRVRQHQFSHQQLHSPAGTSLLVASLFVERAAAGVSLSELLDRVRSKISSDTDHLLQLDRVVALTLGDSWRHALDEKFDWHLAQESLGVYQPADIPSIGPELPSGVSDVRFRADLSEAPSVTADACRRAGGLFRAMLPR